MLFNSFQFLLFFPVVTVLYYVLPHRFRWLMLLLASCGFYMAFIPQYIVILAITIVIDYVAGIKIEDSNSVKIKRAWLVGSILSTCLVLAIFKYFNFLNANFKALADVFALHYPVPMLNLILPIGLSFHTFQSLSYVIEVHRGAQKAERNFGIYSLYVMFYPQLVAGPIERPQNLLHQFHEYHPFDASNISKGLRQMLWGFFMKVVVADQMGVYVNTVYGAPGYQSGPSLLLATVCFAFQLYCDFAGYSNIAIGAGRTMGFHMMTNFRRPYFSRSISEFWKRWHISLGTWFRDYLYIPLGGNRVGKPRYYFNLMLTFLVSGLWHGASWNFVVWGGIHGALQVAEAITRKFRQRFGLDGNWGFLPILQGMYVFAFANLAWIFFRAPTWDQAIQIIRDIFTKGGKLFIGRGPDKFTLIYGGIAVLILLTVEFFDEFHPNSIQLLHNKNRTVRYATSFALLSYIMLLGVFSSSQFLYFQF